MPQADVFYSIRFTNEVADGGHSHFMYIKLDPSDKLARHLRMLEGNNPALKFDETSIKRFGTLHEVQEYNAKLRDDANAANPDRIGAEQLHPDAPNRILSTGSPALDALAK